MVASHGIARSVTKNLLHREILEGYNHRQEYLCHDGHIYGTTARGENNGPAVGTNIQKTQKYSLPPICHHLGRLCELT